MQMGIHNCDGFFIIATILKMADPSLVRYDGQIVFLRTWVVLM